MPDSELTPDGRWVPSVSLPLYGLVFKVCRCGRRFLREEGYRDHYRKVHTIDDH